MPMRFKVARTLLWLVWSMHLGCAVERVGLEDLACTADGRCWEGYECHPQRQVCVTRIRRACGSEGKGVCWSTVTDTTACESEDAFVPCGPVEDCSLGCRTCTAGVWGACVDAPEPSLPACDLGTVDHCGACFDSCRDRVANATPVCTEGACDYTVCRDGFADADSQRDNGCECDLRAPDSPCRPSVPPRLVLSITPAAGTIETDFDLTVTTQDSADLATLRFEWDLDADGQVDATSADPGWRHRYPREGLRRVVVTGWDTADRVVGIAEAYVSVVAPSRLFVVTQSVDSSAANTLRGALAQVIQAGGGAITFEAPAGKPLVIRLLGRLPQLNTNGVTLMGTPNTVVDCNGHQGTALVVDGNLNTVVGLRIQGCRDGIDLQGKNNRVAYNHIEASARAGILDSGTNNIVGPGNVVSKTQSGGGIAGIVAFGSANSRVIGNRVVDNQATGILIDGNSPVSVEVVGNVVAHNVGPGIALARHQANSSSANMIWHNTLYGNGVGVWLGSDSRSDVRNNAFVANVLFGLERREQALTTQDRNGYFANGAPCFACTPGPGSMVDVDPLFVATRQQDFRLFYHAAPPAGFRSPYVDSGDASRPDVWDANGPARGDFWGLAPDIGAFEAYP